VSALSFELSRHAGDPATGFDLGDIQVTGDQASVSSAGQKPSQSMMIYVSLSELLDALSRMARAGAGRYAFIGVDSSFRLDFELTGAGVMTIIGRGGTLIAKAPLATCLVSLRTGLERFLGPRENQLPAADPVAGDLRAARQSFEAASEIYWSSAT
jgi:hypothetical protein